jgi:hypothetical protein
VEDCIFENNYSGLYADDIMLKDTTETIELKNISSTGFHQNSIYGSLVTLDIEDLQLKDNLSNSFEGGGIYCYDCPSVKIKDSQFINIKGAFGGALYFYHNSADPLDPYSVIILIESLY